MFSKLSLLALSAVAFIAVAAVPTPGGGGQCNTGSMQCCNSVEDSKDLSTNTFNLLGLLGIVVGDLTGEVGVTCSPISVLSLSGNTCTANPVCCEDNNFNGLVAIGCNSINL